MNIHEILQGVRDGSIELAKAEELLKDLPYEDIGFAKLDHHRALRTGFGEVVYCAGKTTEHLVEIYSHFAGRGSSVLGTRASEEQYAAVKALLPRAALAPLLARNIGDIGMLEISRIYAAADPVADHKARAVGIGEHDQSPLFRHRAQQRHFLRIVEYTEALGGEDGRIHQRLQGDLLRHTRAARPALRRISSSRTSAAASASPTSAGASQLRPR